MNPLFNLVTGPTDLPVTMREAKEACDVTDTDDDATILMLIEAATELVEVETGKRLLEQTWSRKSSCARGRIEIKRGPFRQVSLMRHYDRDNVLQTLDVASDFFVYSDEDRFFIEPQPNKSWPEFYDRQDAFEIQFTVGFDADKVPAALRKAILMLVAEWFDQPHAATDKPRRQVPIGVRDMIQTHKVGWAA